MRPPDMAATAGFVAASRTSNMAVAAVIAVRRCICIVAVGRVMLFLSPFLVGVNVSFVVSCSTAIFNGTTPDERKRERVASIDRQLVVVVPRGTVVKALVVGTIAATKASHRYMVDGLPSVYGSRIDDDNTRTAWIESSRLFQRVAVSERYRENETNALSLRNKSIGQDLTRRTSILQHVI
jgi:hypothetical protein